MAIVDVVLDHLGFILTFEMAILAILSIYFIWLVLKTPKELIKARLFLNPDSIRYILISFGMSVFVLFMFSVQNAMSNLSGSRDWALLSHATLLIFGAALIGLVHALIGIVVGVRRDNENRVAAAQNVPIAANR